MPMPGPYGRNVYFIFQVGFIVLTGWKCQSRPPKPQPQTPLANKWVIIQPGSRGSRYHQRCYHWTQTFPSPGSATRIRSSGTCQIQFYQELTRGCPCSSLTTWTDPCLFTHQKDLQQGSQPCRRTSFLLLTLARWCVMLVKWQAFMHKWLVVKAPWATDQKVDSSSLMTLTWSNAWALDHVWPCTLTQTRVQQQRLSSPFSKPHLLNITLLLFSIIFWYRLWPNPNTTVQYIFNSVPQVT